MIKLTDILREVLEEKKDACYYKVKSRYKVWPSALASGALGICRKVGADKWGNKTNEGDSQIISELYDQNTIKQIFESNPELANIGTPEQYSEYLDSIFPSSRVKGIYYHTSPNKIDKFRETMFGTYFAYSPIENAYGGVVNSALLNVKNPLVKPKPTDSPEEKARYDKEYRNYNNPSSPYDASIEGSTVTKEGTQIRVKTPDQIHVLGSEEDAKKFEQYVEKRITEVKKETLHQRGNRIKREGSTHLDELRQGLLDYLKQQLPNTPEYVIKDMIYRSIKTAHNAGDVDQEYIDQFKNIKWELKKDFPINLDIFDAETIRRIKEREGGSENPYNIPKDKERHETQKQLILKKGLPKEPIILFKKGSKYELAEGWHRIIQLLNLFPEGFKYPNVYIGSNAPWLNEVLTEKQKETLHQWFKRRGAKGKSSGWIDCNAPDGEGGYKPCGRKEGEKRSEYPACRRTPAACKDPGKGTKWGKKSK